MNVGLKSSQASPYGQQMASADLANRLNEAKEELSGAIESADAERIIELRQELDRLPVLIHTAQITELRNRISTLDADIETQVESIRLIHEVVVRYNREYQAEMERVRPFRERYDEATLKKLFAEEELQMMRASRRDARRELDELTEELKS